MKKRLYAFLPNFVRALLFPSIAEFLWSLVN
jgi:hypothetical protein